MAATEKHFSEQYRIARVHTENRGWDFTATSRTTGRQLQLEIKGHLGDVIQFELTPNEFEKMQANHRTYRICVVRQALRYDTVEVYVPREKNGRWQLVCESTSSVVQLTPKTAARARQIR
jgi:hypothetical protein